MSNGNGKALILPAATQGPRGSESRAASALLAVGQGLSRDQIELLKRTVAKGVTDDELALFVHVANRAGLDPFAKQLHAVKRFDRKMNREVMSIQTGIDGFRLIAARTKAHAGTDEAVFEEEDGRPKKATVTVWKVVSGLRVAFTASARWEEYVQTFRDRDTGQEKPSGLWGKMPFVMLAKCAEAQALRKAFPADLSGVYAQEEIGAMEETPIVTVAPGEPAGAPDVVDADAAKRGRSALAEILKAGGKADAKRIAAALGFSLDGRKPSEIEDREYVLLGRHLPTPFGAGEPLPMSPDSAPSDEREPGDDNPLL